MALNLSRNGPALQAAYGDVVSDKTATDWALFTYEGNSNDLRLAGTGDGGLEELVEELSSGKVMYAFCRVKDPNSGLPKFVLINWTGEGVKDARKGLCANHVSSVGNFLKGAHVTINARAEEDVEPEVIIEKVAKASGANYNFHKESSRFQDTHPQGPVGSVYKKTNAMSEIRSVNKESFWAQTEKDEEKRREEDKKKRNLEHEGLEQERKAREQKESELREQRFKERASQIDQEKQFQKKQDSQSREHEKQRWNEQEQEYQAAMRKGFKRSQSIEKATEAASVISQRSVHPKELFKDRERGMAGDSSSVTASMQPGKLRSPFLQSRSSQPEPPPSPVRPAAQPEPPPSPVRPAAQPTPQETLHSSPERAEDQPKKEDLQPEWNDEQAESKEGYSWKFHHSETLEHEDIYDDPDTHVQEQDSHEPVSVLCQQVATREIVRVQDGTREQVHKDTGEQAVTEDTNVHQPVAETPYEGLCARALYDYQAADETEISFDPDDILTKIEQIDEGWWRGYAVDGSFGMFPANYVELLSG
ncbi:drebrin-like b isoform X2 [Scyliorhinus torazame]|uniref:drebrin-like b isoform X2 n=1 Tax=Scyliorhinus torazame TaxID=75743 RepID=UPI003B5BB042